MSRSLSLSLFTFNVLLNDDNTRIGEGGADHRPPGCCFPPGPHQAPGMQRGREGVWEAAGGQGGRRPLTSVRRSKSPLKRRLPQPRGHTSLQEYTVIFTQGNININHHASLQQHTVQYQNSPGFLTTCIHESQFCFRQIFFKDCQRRGDQS